MAQIEESVARYLQHLDTTDRQEASMARETKTARLKDKIAILKREMQRLAQPEAQMIGTPDQQISLTDPDARSMATSGRGTGMVGYNVQTAVETKHHLIVAHEVTNTAHDTTQLSSMAKKAKAALDTEHLEVVADRGFFESGQILACKEAGSAFFAGHGGSVRLLEKEAVEIEGVAILGATLWTSHGCPDPLKASRIGSALNDFRLIKTRGKAGSRNPATGERAFYSDQTALFEQNPQLRLWAHGHTHRNCCYRLGAHGALVDANQRGYATENSARDFDARRAEFELEAIKQG